jgi:putative peptidoglycan lipid II flippase
MLVCPALFAVSTLATSALNGLDRFLLAAAAPLMYNLALCAGAIFLRPLGAEGLAISAVAGALLHLLVQLPGLARVGMRYTATLGLDLSGTREVARLMGPRVLGLGVYQINQLVTIALASFLGQGSVAYLSYAWLVLMVPLGIIAMSISTATFPSLAREAAAGNLDQARQTFQFGFRVICALNLAAAALLLVLARPAVGLLLERGEFGPDAATATAFALMWYVLGLPGHGAIEIISRAFYAMRDTATPVRVAAGAVALNIVLSLILMRTSLGFGGLALANAAAALTEAITLSILLQRRLGWIEPGAFLPFLGRAALAAVALAAAALLVMAPLSTRMDIDHWTGQATSLASALVVGGLVYVLANRALGVLEPARAVALLLRRA